MTLTETSNLLDKIKIHRPYFAGQFDKSGLEKLKKEWHRVLEPYDVEDINNELDDFLKDGDNLNKQPDVYQLIKYCKTNKQKQMGEENFKVNCKFCNRSLDYIEIVDHENRCRSIMYLKRIYLKYFPNHKLPIKELYEMSNNQFDDNYFKIIEVVKNKIIPTTDEFKLISNVLETKKGNKEIYRIEELNDKKQR